MKKFDNFYIQGGCIMENIGHYLRVFSERVIHESNAWRESIGTIWRIHTSFLVYQEWLNHKEFFHAMGGSRINDIFEIRRQVLNFELGQIRVPRRPIYHKRYFNRQVLVSAQDVHLVVPEAKYKSRSFTDLEDTSPKIRMAVPRHIFQHFKTNFTLFGLVDQESYRRRLYYVLDRIDPNSPIFVLDVPGSYSDW